MTTAQEPSPELQPNLEQDPVGTTISSATTSQQTNQTPVAENATTHSAPQKNRLPMLIAGLSLAAVIILGSLFFLLNQPAQPVSLNENPADNAISAGNSNSDNMLGNQDGAQTISLRDQIQPPLGQNTTYASEELAEQRLAELNPVSSQVELQVEWFDQPIAIAPTEYYTGEEFYDEANQPDFFVDTAVFEFDPVEKLNETYTIQEVGEVKNSDLAGYSVVLIERNSSHDFAFSAGSLLYRVLVSPDDQEKIILTDLSNTLSPMDRPFYSLLENVGLQGLRAPKSFSLNYNNSQLTFLAKPFTTARTFDWWQNSPQHQVRQLATHPTLGSVYEDLSTGFFIVVLPDSSMQFYDLQINDSQRQLSKVDFPENAFGFRDLTGDEFTRELFLYSVLNLSFTTSEGESISNQYTFNELSPCQPLQVAASYEPPDFTDWRSVGSLEDGSFVYQQTLDAILDRLEFRVASGNAEEAAQQEKDNYGRVIIQDDLDRWITLTDTRFQGGAEADCSTTQNRAEAI